VLKIGRKTGTYFVSTVLASYNLDVYVDVENEDFTILVPTSPRGKVDIRRRDTFELCRGRDLADVKTQARDLLRARDVTGYRDVLELDVDWGDHENDNQLRFKFEVARVSEAVDGQGDPKLEKRIEVSDEGVISEICDADGESSVPKGRSFRSNRIRIPYTVERWRKCVAIRDGISYLRECLKQLFKDETCAPGKIDSLSVNPARMLTAGDEDSGQEPRVPSKGEDARGGGH
jgi:hypothetical protein